MHFGEHAAGATAMLQYPFYGETPSPELNALEGTAESAWAALHAAADGLRKNDVDEGEDLHRALRSHVDFVHAGERESRARRENRGAGEGLTAQVLPPEPRPSKTLAEVQKRPHQCDSLLDTSSGDSDDSGAELDYYPGHLVLHRHELVSGERKHCLHTGRHLPLIRSVRHSEIKPACDNLRILNSDFLELNLGDDRRRYLSFLSKNGPVGKLKCPAAPF